VSRACEISARSTACCALKSSPLPFVQLCVPIVVGIGDGFEKFLVARRAADVFRRASALYLSIGQRRTWALRKRVEMDGQMDGAINITVADIVKVTGTSRNTIKDHVKMLTEKRHLARHGAGRGTWYLLA